MDKIGSCYWHVLGSSDYNTREFAYVLLEVTYFEPGSSYNLLSESFDYLLLVVNPMLTFIQHEQKVRRTVTRYGFEAQLLDKYTRNVYNVFREKLYHIMAFRIKQSQEDPRNYLVHHYNQSRVFAWSRHEFRVTANEEEGQFRCECKLWEHTGTHFSNLLHTLPKKTSKKAVSRTQYEVH